MFNSSTCGSPQHLKGTGKRSNGLRLTIAKDTVTSEPSTPDSDSLPSSKTGSFQTANHVIMIPRIVLTRPSTSDEDADQLTQDPDDSEPEETDNTESHLYSDCLNHAFYPP
uniref:Uncharacterized protein n=1 Tax=Sphaerodactylus townsendi TaxID=933632 RepID=A0ACB8GDA1_9SAUR